MRRKKSRCLRTVVLQIGLAFANYYAAANHEAASQFVGQRNFAVKYAAGAWTGNLLAAAQLYGLPLSDPVQWVIRSAGERN
jgi:hypothetical protein